MENYFNYEMKDGTYMHLEFADHSITEEDLRKYREFEESLEEFYGAPVQTMVICSADVKSIKTELRDGNSIYQIRTISMGEQDGDQILREKNRRKEIDIPCDDAVNGRRNIQRTKILPGS